LKSLCRIAGIFLAGALHAAQGPTDAERIVFPVSVQQGAMVIGKVPPGSQVDYAQRHLRVTPYGTVGFGVGRSETGPLRVEVRGADGRIQSVLIEVVPRQWPVERVDGVPPKTVDPPADIAARIRREQAAVAAAREADNPQTGFTETFIRPLQGRISGHFGSQRVYNGTPGSAHSGMDFAAPAGTLVRAPASGTVIFAEPDLYLTGGTLLIDHGHGFSSNFLHLSRIDVAPGEHVEQGQVIAAVGSRGRANGPHLHWGMTWFDVRIDPDAVLQRH
jgi:murein DD-endopeptidase MepM/ murein hydrolase activator NlpD